jgi:hypothetical protein
MEKFKLVSETIEKAERFDYRKVSEQVKDLIEILSNLHKEKGLIEKIIRKIFVSSQTKQSEIKRERYSQISDRAFRFLTSEAFNNLSGNEKEIILFYLLTSPSPKEQDKILNSISFLFEDPESFKIKNQEALEIEIKNLIKYLLLNEALKAARDSGWWDILLSFFQNPENQNKFPDIFNEALEEVNRERRWDILLSFFQNPENQNKFPDIFNEALEEARNNEWWNILLLFFQNQENQNKFPDLFNEALEETRRERRWNILLLFFQNPENQNKFPDIFNEALEGVRNNEWWDTLLLFFQNPENQNKFPDIFNEALEGTRKKRWWHFLLLFFQNPENQNKFPDIFNEALEGVRNNEWWDTLLLFFQNPENQNKFPDIFNEALEEASRREWWTALLLFFQNPQNQPKINESFINAGKALFSISDKNLRTEYLNQMKRYLSSNEPLTLISLSRAEDLPLLIVGKNLGINPFVILSWNLSKKERESLFPIFISLANKNFKFDFPFPYYPRQELKRTKKHNEMLIEYFRILDFILSLPKELMKVSSGQDHFENVQTIIKNYNIEQTTLDVSYSFLKEILKEIKKLEEKAIKRISEFLGISQAINYEEIKNFIAKSSYSPIILTLAIHYSKIYKDGLPLLGKITSSLIKDPTLKDYFQMRYDINDPITREQLNPLLEGKTPQEYPQIIEKWRNPYYTFKILSQEEREKIETAGIDWDKVWEHIKSQTYGDKHYEQLFILEEFKNLDEENKNKIRKVIDVLFVSDKKTINFGETRKILQGKLAEKKINILIGYFQLLRDISLKQKTLQEILSSIERLNKNIQENWQEFGQLIMWQQDIYNYLAHLIKEQERERKIIRKQTILLSYFTDHPKTLFEIGKYPVSTCQDYESTGDFNTKLLGYVFDAHIKALVLREIEIETEEEIRQEDLNQAKVNLDEEKERFIITLLNGKTITGKISKPIARRMVMLGKKNEKPALLLEPVYSKRGKGDKTYRKFLDSPLNKIKNELNLEITESGEEIILPKSHNPGGYYRDV